MLLTTSDMFPIERAVHLFDQRYVSASLRQRLLLKAWLYYCQCRAKAGAWVLSFESFMSNVSLDYLLSLVRGCCLDLSDIGGVTRATALLLNSVKEENV